MDTTLVPTVEIPRGLVQVRTMCGLTTEAALTLFGLAAVLFLGFRSLWLPLLLVPVWGFLRYQSKREPLFLHIWAGQLRMALYYHG